MLFPDVFIGSNLIHKNEIVFIHQLTTNIAFLKQIWL